MTEWSPSRRETLKALGVTTAGVFGIPTAAAQTAPQATLTVDPSESSALSGETVTVDVVIEGATAGIQAYEFDLLLGDTSVGRVVGFDEQRDRLSDSEILGDGEGVRFETALLDGSYEGATAITVASVTLSAEGTGQSDITFSSTQIQSNNDDGDVYQTGTDPGSLTVDPDERELSAALELDPTTPEADELVTLDASASTGDIVEYRWTLGDGTEQTTSNVLLEHTYATAGTYEVTLAVESGDGETDQTSQQVTVTEGPDDVEAAFDWEPSTAQAGAVVNFDATGSTGDIVEYRWDFTTDGTVDETSDAPGMVNVYDEPGEYQVTLEVKGTTDSTDQTTATVPVVSSDEPLAAAFEWNPPAPQAGDEVVFDASGSTGSVVEYRWDLTGDDTTDQTTDGPTTTFTYEQPGTRSVTLELVDGSGNTESTTNDVTVDESDDESDGGSDNGSENGSDGGSDEGSGDDSENGSDGGSDEGSGDDSENGSDGGSDEGSGDGSENGSDGGADSGSGSGSDEGSGDDSENGSDGGADSDPDDGSGDGFGPGFGPMSALSGLGGAAYLLKRRLLDGESED